MLPNTSALDRQRSRPHEVHSMDDLVRLVLAQLGDRDDPGAACRAVADFCSLDGPHRAACKAGGDAYVVVTNRVFRSTEQDRALFAHDELLANDPKAAFEQACKDRQIARAAGLDWLSNALEQADSSIFYQWVDEEWGAVEWEAAHAREIMNDFHDAHPLLCKVHEWRLVARDEYEWGIRPSIKVEYKGSVGVADWIGEAAFGQRYDPSTYNAFRNTSLWNILGGYDVSSYPRSSMENGPVLAARFAHTERRVRALAARVGRAMVFAFHKNAKSASDPGGADALAYVASEPRVLP